ncbi:hypothetical protein [Paraflavitalea speifideaquila]|uniref:hypothetical protein n=1 Tax=Paraflavitalea speifideaquila TaxID=3076558 RepID=UPI0028ECF87B|nr:hypothetical protein [Paraflavitalea speifideiaquila]
MGNTPGFPAVFHRKLLFSPAVEPEKGFSRQDTLRGSLRPERTWWDVQRYDVHVTPDYNSKTISGVVYMHFKKVVRLALP